MTDTPPPQQPNFKAQAAADKAYAKASRPWYKKKRWIAAMVIGVLAIIGIASGGGSDTGTTSASDETSSSTSADAGSSPGGSDSGSSDQSGDQVGTKDNPASVGTTVKNDSASYTIDNVAVRDSLGQFSDPPSGKFVVVTLTVKNLKKSTIQVSSEDFKLQVAGTEVETDSDAIFLDDAFNYDDLSPGLKRTGKIVFDVAPANAGKGVLVAQALLSLDDARYLNLQK